MENGESQSSHVEVSLFGSEAVCNLDTASPAYSTGLFWLQTVSHELEEDALRREREADQHLKGLSAAAAAKEHKQTDELKTKEQQISDLQVVQCAFYVLQGLSQLPIQSAKLRQCMLSSISNNVCSISILD